MADRDSYSEVVISMVQYRCRQSFFYFVTSFWDVIIKERPVYNWHIPYLCAELEILAQSVANRRPKPYDLIINIPPGTTKSTIVTVMFPVWLWIQDPSLQIITNSYSGGLSIEHATKSKDIILSDKFRKLFPEITIRRDKSGKQHYGNTLGGFRYATSTGATITGFHAHLIINDDPVNPKQADSEQLRHTAIEHLKTLSSRKVDKANTPIVTVMQRLHVEDVTGYQLKNKGESIKHICLPAELTDAVCPAELADKYVDGLLDPVRLNRHVLDEARVDLGSIHYAGQYLQSPVVSGGNIVKDSWFEHISFADFQALRMYEPMYYYLDTAFSKQKKGGTNDPSGIISVCRIGNKLYVYHAQKMYMEMPQLLRFLPDYISHHEGTSRSILYVEPKANGKSVVQMLKEISTLNVRESPAPLDSKEVRLRAISPRIECGRVVLVEGNWNRDFVEELCGFPNAPHDEYVDILGYAIRDILDNEDDDIDWDNLTKYDLGL